MKLPFNIHAWIAENRALLQPPVGNKCLFKDDHFIIMIVGGPNDRSDYHYNETPEFFFQLEGRLELDIQVEGAKQTHVLEKDDVYFLPAKVPHRPRRFPNSVGLVVELQRKNAQDGLMWFCEKCNHSLFEKYFPLKNIETDFQQVFDQYFSDAKNGQCPNCDVSNF